jgi:MscS family membrane protein
VIFRLLYNVADEIKGIFSHFSKKLDTSIGQDIENFLRKTLKFLIVVFGIMTMLQEWGVNIVGFVASLGIGGLALALAAKDTAANLFGTLVLFLDRPFKIGDWIDTGSAEGVVEDIGFRSTKVRTFAKSITTVPNATLANASINNWSRMNKRRIKMRLGLVYSTTKEQMENILKDIKTMLQNHPHVHQDQILINFDQMQDSALSIFCYFFTTTTKWDEYLNVREDVNLKLMDIVYSHKSDFAFPSQSIYVEKVVGDK